MRASSKLPTTSMPGSFSSATAATCSAKSLAAEALACASSRLAEATGSGAVPCQQRYRWHLEKNATQMAAISWQLTWRPSSMFE